MPERQSRRVRENFRDELGGADRFVQARLVGAELQQQRAGTDVLVVVAAGVENSFDQARILLVGQRLDPFGQLQVGLAVRVLPSDHQAHLGHLFARHLGAVHFGGNGVAVDVDQRHRALLQQLPHGGPRALVRAAVVGQVAVGGVNDFIPLPLQCFLQRPSHLDDVAVGLSERRRWTFRCTTRRCGCGKCRWAPGPRPGPERALSRRPLPRSAGTAEGPKPPTDRRDRPGPRPTSPRRTGDNSTSSTNLARTVRFSSTAVTSYRRLSAVMYCRPLRA